MPWWLPSFVGCRRALHPRARLAELLPDEHPELVARVVEVVGLQDAAAPHPQDAGPRVGGQLDEVPRARGVDRSEQQVGGRPVPAHEQNPRVVHLCGVAAGTGGGAGGTFGGSFDFLAGGNGLSHEPSYFGQGLNLYVTSGAQPARGTYRAFAVAPTPEPLSVAVFGGLVGVGGLVARRRMKA